MKRALASLIVVWLFSAAQAASAQLAIQAQPGEVMQGESLTVNCYSSGEMNSTVRWHITSPVSSSWVMSQVNQTHYQHVKGITSYFAPGNYTIHCTNGSLSSPSGGFAVYTLNAAIKQCNDSAYSNQNLNMRVEATKDTGTTQYLESGVTFRVYLDSAEVGLADSPFYYPSAKEWMLVTGSLSSFAPKDYTLKVEAAYNGRSFSAAKPFALKPEYVFCIDDISPVEINGGETVTVRLAAKHRGVSILGDSDIDVEFDGEDIDFERNDNGFTFTAPEIASGSHELFVEMDYGGRVMNDTGGVDYLLPVSGEFIDANGKAVSGSLKFARDAYQKTITSDSTGSYSGNVPSGTYRITANLPGVKATVSNAVVTGTWDDIMRFDSFTGSNVLEGLQEGMAFALELPLDFDDIRFEAAYDAAKVSDETDIRVYGCHDWNLEARRCEGEWDRVSADVDTSANTVSFMVSQLSAFVAGNSLSLVIDAKADRESYFLGEEMEVTGYVKNKKGEVVPDAKVEVRAGGSTGEAETNQNGVFTARVAAPKTEGEHTVLVTASKGLYEAVTHSIPVTVEKQKGLTVILPVSTSITVNTSSSMQISVFNSGQDTLRDLEVEITGLPEGTFSYEPGIIRKLEPGEEETISLRTNLPGSDRNSYVVDIRIRGGEIEKKEKFVVSVSGQSRETASRNASQQAGEPGFGLDFMSGLLLVDASGAVNIASIIASVLILGILIAKMRGKTRVTRTHVRNLVNSVKQEVSRGAFGKGSPEKTAKKRTQKGKGDI